MPVNLVDLPNHRTRCKALLEAQSNTTKHLDRSSLDRTLRAQVPKASMDDISSGMDVLVYREKPTDKWEGPDRVVSCSCKQVWLNVNDKGHIFLVDNVNEYVPLVVIVKQDAQAASAARATDNNVRYTVDNVNAGEVRNLFDVAQDSATLLALPVTVPGSDVGPVVDNVIAGDVFIADVGRRVGEMREKAQRAAP